MISRKTFPLFFSIAFLCAVLPTPTLSTPPPNFVKFPSHGLSTALTWDPLFNHFLTSSQPHHHPPSILSISDTGVTDLLFTDPSLPPNSTFLALSLDPLHRRLLAVLRSAPLSSPHLLFLASYDLNHHHHRLFITQLSPSSSPLSAHIAVDTHGSAYVTHSVENIIWKVTVEGRPTVFSRSRLFTDFPVITEGFPQVGNNGLNGIVYVSKGYLLVVQSNTGKMFKVKEEDGTARVVELTEDLAAAEGMVVRRRDGVVVVMGDYRRKVLYLKSYDSWGTGVVYDGKVIDKKKNKKKRVPLGVATGEGDRVYVLYGGGWEEEEEKGAWFNIEEIVPATESGEEEEHVWIFILVGLGLVYFWFWRFQMGRLFFNLNKKIQ